MDKKFAIIPTMPSRINFLPTAIGSIINQVDMLYIYLNEFKSIPDFLVRDKIQCIIGKDWGSAARFYISDKVKGYLTFLDDDLIYPPDFIDKSIAKVEQYNRKAIITLHGRILKQPINNWIIDQIEICRCLCDLPYDKEIHVAGTGVMTYHSDTINISLDDFHNRNLDDVEFSIFAQKQNVPIIAVNHTKGFVINQLNVDKGYTIWKETIKDPEPLLNLARSIYWKLTGIKTDNNDILLEASDENMEIAIENKRDTAPVNRRYRIHVWREKMNNLMERRKERKKNPVCMKKSIVNRYDLHVKKIVVGKRVLDVGCGSMIIKTFLSNDVEYIGIDAYPAKNGVVKMEIERCIYPDKYFDTVFAFAVLDSVYNIKATLKQIQRITKTNILILTGLDIAPNEFHTYTITEDLLDRRLSKFKQGYKEYFTKNVGLIEYKRRYE